MNFPADALVLLRCFVCRDPLTSSMCQSAITVGGSVFRAHVPCADAWASEEIDVFKVTSPGNGSYLEDSLETVTDMLRDSDVDSEYVIQKMTMTRGHYAALPEFTGF